MRDEVKTILSELLSEAFTVTQSSILSPQHFRLITRYSLLITLSLLTACGANVAQVIPTNRPTITPTATETPTRTPGFNVSPTFAPTRTPASVAGGPSPTSIFGPTSTPADAEPTPTRVRNPNAPRIEFFTSDTLAVAPGDLVTLYWSSRGVNGVVLYRLDESGTRNQLWNVGPDGSLTVATRRSDRGQVVFVLSVGDGEQNVEQELVIPLSCPDPWFFLPAPETCPNGAGEATALLEERFERGRMIYVENNDRVYTLFNDGRTPAWIAFENRYNQERDPESEPSFVPPPPLVQPLRILGFVWRGNDVVRNRLGLGLEPEFAYEGFIQTAIAPDGAESLYINSADGTVLQLLPGGDSWQIITPP
jgi:hypothetical protein